MPPAKKKTNSAPHSPLLPTVAISDVFNALGHAAAAQLVWPNAASLGFAIVAFAATVGVLRFGVSERLFARANQELADLSAFVGLPLVGLAFFQKWQQTSYACIVQLAFVVGCSVLHSLTKELTPRVKELVLVATNVCLFLVPVAGCSLAARDALTAASLALFAFAGIVVGGDKHACMLNIRRVNIFHYAIAVASYGMAFGLLP
jgi:hypothetical protein